MGTGQRVSWPLVNVELHAECSAEGKRIEVPTRILCDDNGSLESRINADAEPVLWSINARTRLAFGRSRVWQSTAVRLGDFLVLLIGIFRAHECGVLESPQRASCVCGDSVERFV